MIGPIFPVIIPIPEGGYDISREKSIQISLSIFIILFVHLCIFILMNFFDINIIKIVGNTIYFVSCALFGFITPFVVGQILRKQFLKNKNDRNSN